MSSTTAVIGLAIGRLGTPADHLKTCLCSMGQTNGGNWVWLSMVTPTEEIGSYKRLMRWAAPKIHAPADLVVDVTAPGVPIASVFESDGIRVIPVTLTDGLEIVGDEKHGFQVPKRHLIASAQAFLAKDEPGGTDDAPLAFADGKLNITRAYEFQPVLGGNRSDEPWRRPHCDEPYVIATSLALWWVQRTKKQTALPSFSAGGGRPA